MTEQGRRETVEEQSENLIENAWNAFRSGILARMESRLAWRGRDLDRLIHTSYTAGVRHGLSVMRSGGFRRRKKG